MHSLARALCRDLSEEMRSHKDLAKDAVPHFAKAKKFYNNVAAELVAHGHTLDMFTCALDQVRCGSSISCSARAARHAGRDGCRCPAPLPVCVLCVCVQSCVHLCASSSAFGCCILCWVCVWRRVQSCVLLCAYLVFDHQPTGQLAAPVFVPVLFYTGRAGGDEGHGTEHGRHGAADRHLPQQGVLGLPEASVPERNGRGLHRVLLEWGPGGMVLLLWPLLIHHMGCMAEAHSVRGSGCCQCEMESMNLLHTQFSACPACWLSCLASVNVKLVKGIQARHLLAASLALRLLM